jgi:hypothetical protein
MHSLNFLTGMHSLNYLLQRKDMDVFIEPCLIHFVFAGAQDLSPAPSAVIAS